MPRKKTENITPKIDIRPGLALSCLMDEPDWVRLLKGRGKPYDRIIDYIAGLPDRIKGLSSEEEKIATTPSRIADTLGEQRAHIYKWLRQMYLDILELIKNQPELFVKDGTHACVLSIYSKTLKDYITITLGLPYIPRLDEFISIDFLAGFCPTSHFIITDISHYHSKWKVETYLECRPEYIKNKYRDLIHEKLYF